ncbi:cytochrome C550 [Ruegeria sp. ANG-R]|uniref:c-type cytochrome n=1 Tax=Ruegeria sp. ANG-R TaxID=1577903 RepID=UPI0005804FC9|nr:c-type cytochrome [Ruegeria sp. ANG-R]KIC38636.1 cytochrome C550 [Ruegeria sp. ANG-R]
MNRILATAIVGLMALPAYAEGDAEAGKKTFNKCKSCHQIADPAGDVIVKGGKTGPNLYGVAGRTAGTVEGFKYGDSIVAAGENGLVWDEANFVEYAQDPKGFLKSYLDDTSAKSKMTFKLKKGAADVYAYIASVSGE